MEGEGDPELVPLPADGYGCDFTRDMALTRALLESCQSRAAAISGAREDITRGVYPETFDRERLAEWREFLTQSGGAVHSTETVAAPSGRPARLDAVVAALAEAGAQAIVVVPLFIDERAGIFVVRVVAPPLRQHPGH
jgi:ribosomal protein S12 methylthiotransferase accessory factor